MLKRTAVAIVVAGVGSGGLLVPTAAASATSSTVSAQDIGFLRDAAATDLAEITLGHVALARAVTPESKHYASRMIKDHTAMLEDARTVASALGISLPNAPTAAQRKVAKFVAAQSGLTFDAAYLESQVAGHTMAVADGVKEIKFGSNVRVKGQAVDGSPMIRYHLWLGVQYFSWVSKAIKAS